MIVRKPKILFYDIESTLLKAWIFDTGKQVIRHGQLVQGFDQFGIICIAYSWLGEDEIHTIDWGYEEQDSESVIQQFDKVVRQADHTIGKNSARFDVKMINSIRALKGLPGYPDWADSSDDLEQQMRKYFRLPSYSLDYISKQLGYGGKDKMEFDDWVNISEKNENGLTSFKKMIEYNIKDVEDTKNVWEDLSHHFDPKFNMNVFLDNREGKCCKQCGSENIFKNGTKFRNLTKYQTYYCKDCGRYAGKSIISKTGKESGIR